MANLPAFDKSGLLPPGDYELTIEELRQSPLVKGPGTKAYSDWDSKWRELLVANLGVLAGQLWKVGVDDIFIDGSFVEDKLRPNDIDGYFVCRHADITSGRLTRDLNLLDDHKIWTWSPASRRHYLGSQKTQLPMWHRYRVELYPYWPGQLTDMRDPYGRPLSFPSAFRLRRGTLKQKGIIRILE